MLWVGWFGFNGGSALAADASAGDALLATHLAAATAALMWAALERAKIGKATSIGLVTGAVAGLATVTPAAGYISPLGGMVAGGLGALICFAAVLAVKQRWRLDDSLDVFAVHGVGGMAGSLLLAPLANPSFGGTGPRVATTIVGQLGAQAAGVGIALLWSLVLTYAIAKIAALFVPMRVDAEAEHDGLDLSSHGERAYEFD
jgi:Amt family ammonium transporter